MRRLLTSIACLLVLAPASASCMLVCGDLAPAATAMATAMAEHCSESRSQGPSHGLRDEAPSPDPTQSCAACGLHAVSELDSAAVERVVFEFEGPRLAVTRQPTPSVDPPRARRTIPRSGAPPPAPLAIRHAPLLI